MKGFAIILLLAAGLLNVGCTRTVTVVCPAVTTWTEGQQAEAAEEIQALPPGSILTEMMLDYGRLRARLRECAP